MKTEFQADIKSHKISQQIAKIVSSVVVNAL